MTMKVFDLACDAGHGFEGWFGSAGAFDDQRRRRLIACPVCGGTEVRKLLSAPRLNLRTTATSGEMPRRSADRAGPAREQGGEAGRGREGPDGRVGRGGPEGGRPIGVGDERDGQMPAGADAADPSRLERMFLALARQLIASTEDVGDRFVDEARKIHYDEAPSRAIRGSATREEAAELRDEGIEVFAIPVPEGLKGPLQ